MIAWNVHSPKVGNALGQGLGQGLKVNLKRVRMWTRVLLSIHVWTLKKWRVALLGMYVCGQCSRSSLVFSIVRPKGRGRRMP